MDRAERRYRSKVKQDRRKNYNTNPECHADGKMRKTPTPCSCWLCKPHKHGIEPKYKPSEQRKLQDDGQSNI